MQVEVNRPTIVPELKKDTLKQMLLELDLTGMEVQASAELNGAMRAAGLSEDPLRDYYLFLGRERDLDLAKTKKPIVVSLVEAARNAAGEIKEKGVRQYSRDQLQKGTTQTAKTVSEIKERAINISLSDLKKMGVILSAAVAGGTIGRTAQEGVYTSEALLKNLVNSILSFSGSSIPEVNGWALLTGASAGVVYLGIPWYLSGRITEASRRTEEKLNKQRIKSELRNKADLAIVNGEADLRYLVHRPIVFIQVGKDDPSVRKFASFLRKIGIEPVTFWDERNLAQDVSRFWMKTGDRYTDPLIFLKANVANACCMVSDVTFGDDTVFANPDAETIIATTGVRTDMVDTEVFDSLSVLRMVAPRRIPHIDTTDPDRYFEARVAGDSDNFYGTKTVGEMLQKFPETAIVNLNQITLAEIARMNPDNLPLELITDPERAGEYEKRLRAEIAAFNKGKNVNVQRYKNPGETRTLSLFYGSTDLKTRQWVATNLDEASKEGDYLAIINDPREINYLPPELRIKKKYICIGSLEADEQMSNFIAFVKKGEIILPADVLEKMREEDWKGGKILGPDEPDIANFSISGAGESLLSLLNKPGENDNTRINQLVERYVGGDSKKKTYLVDYLKRHYPSDDELADVKTQYENPYDNKPETKLMAEYILQNLQTIRGNVNQLLTILS